MSAQNFQRDTVIKIINSVIEKVEGVETFGRDQFFKELHDLKKIIEDARIEISASGAHDIKDKYINSASDELDAIVASTSDATFTIMNACEKIEQESAGNPEILNQVTRIYEACSFQDITGQRIKKIVNSLKQIDEKVTGLLRVLGEKVPGFEKPVEDNVTLLNGPALPGAKAISQDDIDKLLASFDG